ncbi:unnamed protein product [Hymenolepis diminuta]|uniref:Conserved plasma membrane protein n=1 Tax=Hymenolepis diminuta TaxID=6216 RepID=A0A158QEJ1_HYMDI|nr:unnamed protein product [Hymenolepis diminuta]VUZ44217.1 unnamed protein product [Hymenolepis diminuta]
MAKNGVGKVPDNAVGNGEPRLRRQRKRPRRCAIGCYHTSAFILAIGIIVAFAGICSSRLFEIFLYDNRHPPLFHHLTIHVGLFDVRGEKISNGANPTVEELYFPPNLDEPRWLTAKAAAVIGLIFGLVALIIHLALICCSRGREDKPWGTVAVEILCCLIIVIGLLVSLSLAESEIEGVHNHGDETLVRMLQANELLGNGTEIYRSAIPANTDAEQYVPPLPLLNSVAEFNLVLSEPRQSFYVLIAADFICLLAFLMSLVYFVRLSEREEQLRKQLQKAEVAKPISERPLV